VALIGKMIKAREEKGLSQRELAEISGVKHPAIARLESMKATPQIDNLFKVLHPLGYTIEIVPLINSDMQSFIFNYAVSPGSRCNTFRMQIKY
jgi:transcriptional regulator with XRE-family HTH domain